MSDDFFLFVSHVTEERAAAMEIVAELEKRGVPCWIAPRNIGPGTRFDDQIANAIEGCRNNRAATISRLRKPRRSWLPL